MKKRPPAIVSPVGHPRALAVMRSLARNGVRVIAVDASRNPAGFYSHAASEKFRIPPGPEALLDFARRRARHEPAVLFAMSDEVLVRASQNHAELSEAGLMLDCPPWEVLGRFMRRESLYALAHDLGLRTPVFHPVHAPSDLEALLPELDFDAYDWVFKTEVWDVVADPRTRRHTRVLRGPEDVRAVLGEVAPKAVHPMLVERVVPGTASDCVGVTLVVAPNHEPVVSFVVRRLQLQLYERGVRFEHPYELGANAYCESIHDEEALDAAVRLVRAGGYVGTVTVEFRRRASDGGLILIKADPRPVRATALSCALGLDVPRAQYELALGEKPPIRTEYRDGVGWLWIPRFLAMPRAFGGWPRRSRALASLLRRAHRIRSFGYLSLRDPLPFLRDISQFLPAKTGKRARKRLAKMAHRHVPLVQIERGPESS